MNPDTDRSTSFASDASTARHSHRGRHLGEILRGVLFGGIAFLLGSSPLLFGAHPLGIALLAAASSYTLYILGGLTLAAFLCPALPGPWGWVVIYLLCLCLRVLARTYVDPPTDADGRTLSFRAYIKYGIRSLAGRLRPAEEPVGTAARDYYNGECSPRHSTAPSGTSSTGSSYRAERTEPFAHATPPRPFTEHPFLRIAIAAITGLLAGSATLIAGGFRLYDLFALFLMILFVPLATTLLIGVFGETGMTLLFSPTPLAVIRRTSTARSRASRKKEVSQPTGKYAGLTRLVEGLERVLGEDGEHADDAVKHAPIPDNAPVTRGLGRLAVCYPLLPILSVSALLVGVVFAARHFEVALFGPYLTLSLSILLALLLTLSCASRLGVLPGIGMALLLGLCAEPRSIPMFLIISTVYALMRVLSHRAGIIGGCAAGALYTATADGMVTLGGRLPALLLCIPLYLAVERLWRGLPAETTVHADPAAEELSARVSAALSAEARAKAQRARLEALSDALGLLSQRFYKLSGKLRRPRLSELRRLTAEALDAQCAHCRMRDGCRAHSEGMTTRLSEHLAAILQRHGDIDPAELSDELYELCPYLEELCDDIRARHAKLTEALAHSERSDVFAADYAAMAAILSDVLEEDALDAQSAEENQATADRVYEYLSAEGVTVQGVVVSGGRGGRRRIIVQGVGMERLRDDVHTVRDRLESLCGARLSLPAFETNAADGVSVMTVAPETVLDVRYAGSTVPAGVSPGDVQPEPLTDETPRGAYTPPAVCGDHIALFRTERACFYALISDGMGSGEDASLTSDICAMFLERMLSAGGRVEVSLRMLDSYICAKNTGTRDECSATVDLMELDLSDGQAVFAKNGAAPTYVVREGTVYKLRSRTMPLGILKGNDPRLLRFRMHPGDVVVMVSDGVTLGNDDCPWLIDLLSSPLPPSMDTLRADIIRRALSAGSEDDLSAIAIRVEETAQA